VCAKIKAIEFDPSGGPGNKFKRLIDAGIKVYSEAVNDTPSLSVSIRT